MLEGKAMYIITEILIKLSYINTARSIITGISCIIL